MNDLVTYVYAVARNADRLEELITALNGVADAPVRLVPGSHDNTLVLVASHVPAQDFQEDALKQRLEDLDWLRRSPARTTPSSRPWPPTRRYFHCVWQRCISTTPGHRTSWVVSRPCSRIAWRAWPSTSNGGSRSMSSRPLPQPPLSPGEGRPVPGTGVPAQPQATAERPGQCLPGCPAGCRCGRGRRAQARRRKSAPPCPAGRSRRQSSRERRQ